MTISSVGASQTDAVQRVHHHHGKPANAAPAAGTAAPTGDAGDLATAPPAQSGIGKFASELQSILLSAQAGQPNASGATANDPATAADPAGATDATTAPGAAHGGGIRHLADRLQDLLGSDPAAQTAAGGNTLQDVLGRLQTTLQQTLAGYKSAAPAATATSITA